MSGPTLATPRPLRRAAEAFARAAAPPSEQLPSDWARENIIVTKGPKAQAPWCPDNGYEYQIGILDGCWGPNEPGEAIRECVIFKGAKAGITLLANIGQLYTVCARRLSAALVSPRKPDSAQRASELATMIRSKPALMRLFEKVTGRVKEAAAGAELISMSAETERDLIDWGAAVINGDERDRWVTDAGFDQDAMIDERQGGYIERIKVEISTPTVPDYGVHKAFEGSDKRRFFVPCPLCGFRQTLDFFKNVRYDEALKANPDAASVTARFVCQGCERTWNRRARQIANAGGEWVAECPGVRRRGFAISRLYVPTSLPEEFVKAYCASLIDESKAREFYNQKLGVPYLSAIGELKDAAIQRLITAEIQWGQPPAGFTRLFAGVDVQGREEPLEFYLEVRAYNDRGDCALIYYDKLTGTKQLKDALGEKYGGLEIQRALIDISDGHHRDTVEALVKAVGCLEAAKFVWQATIAFQRFKHEQGGPKKDHGISGWAVKRSDALDDNISRFFEKEEKKATIHIARNPNAGREKELVSHYKGLRRTKIDTPRGPEYDYDKRRIEGVDYPFAGALAEIARRSSGAAPGKGAGYGAVSKVREAAQAEAKRGAAQGGHGSGQGGIKIVGRQRPGGGGSHGRIF